MKRWQEDETLEGIVIAKEPPGKLNLKYTKDHFVCTVTCLNTNPAVVTINVNLGAVHLRSLERIESAKLIVIKAVLDDKFSYGLGDKNYQFGAEMFNNQKVKKVLSKLQITSNWQGKNTLIERKHRHLAKQIFNVLPEIDIHKLSVEVFKQVLVELVNRHALTSEIHELVLDNSLVKLLDKISQKVLAEWWRPPYALPYLMSALDETLGLSVLEIQGRVHGKTNEIQWLKIYGAKGAEEKARVSKLNGNNLEYK